MNASTTFADRQMHGACMQHFESAMDNATGDHPRPLYIWTRLAAAAIFALLTIAETIEAGNDRTDQIIQALP